MINITLHYFADGSEEGGIHEVFSYKLTRIGGTLEATPVVQISTTPTTPTTPSTPGSAAHARIYGETLSLSMYTFIFSVMLQYLSYLIFNALLQHEVPKKVMTDKPSSTSFVYHCIPFLPFLKHSFFTHSVLHMLIFSFR